MPFNTCSPCSNTTCWGAALAPVSAKLRKLLGPAALIYTNECANKVAVGETVIFVPPRPPSTFSRRFNSDGEGVPAE